MAGGSRNHWLVEPFFFCENRNISVLKQAFEEELGFARSNLPATSSRSRACISGRRDSGKDVGAMKSHAQIQPNKIFENLTESNS
jgi:altronate hydrolase